MGYLKARVFIGIFLFLFSFSVQLQAAESSSTDLVIYAQGFGVVRGPLALELNRGRNLVDFTDIPEQIQPDSIILDTAGTGVEVIQQKIIQKLDQAMVLEEYEGEVLSFEIISDKGERWVREGRLIRAGNNPIVEFDQKFRFDFPGKPLFDSIDEIAPLKPTLRWQLYSQSRGRPELKLSYITGGISWEANYNAIIEDDSDLMKLTGSFSMENNSGKDFINSSVKLLAGDVWRERRQHLRGDVMMMESAEMRAPGGVSVAALDEYYLYTVEEPVDIKNKELVQVDFLSSSQVKTERRYEFRGNDVEVIVEFENSRENNLGKPLPGGRIKLYRSEGNHLVFIGENSIGHTPPGETVKLKIGSAFDLVGERKQTDARRISTRENQDSYQIIVRNNRKEPVEINIIELIRHKDWEMITASEDFERVDVQTIKFPVEVPAKGEKEVNYTVRVRR